MSFQILVNIVFALMVVSAVFVIIFDDGDSGSKLAWLLVISILPVVGLILYILIGINYRNHYFFQKKHKKAIEKFSSESSDSLKDLFFGDKDIDHINPRFRPLVALFKKGVAGYSFTDGNDMEIITSGKRKMDLLVEDISKAKESIHVEYFHFGKDKGSRVISDLLAKKAKEGVEVRFLNEDTANFPIPYTYYEKMRKKGIEVVHFTNPKRGLINWVTRINYRNHRKILVIDGHIAYTGGMNINNHYFYMWRDTHLRIVGPAVASLQATFFDSWLTSGGDLKRPLSEYFVDFSDKSYKETPRLVQNEYGINSYFEDKTIQIVPEEPTSEWPILLMAYEWVLNNAKDYIYIQSPYFSPPQSFLIALKAAALRGVDVRIMLPRNVDTPLMKQVNMAYYDECLQAGVKLYEREGEFIHSKTFVCDDYLSQIGTANIDTRSFDINYEVNAYIFDEEVALTNKTIFLKDQSFSEEITYEQWSIRPWYKNLLPKIVRLFSGVL